MPCSPVYEFHDINVKNFSSIAKFISNFGDEIKWNLMIIPFCEELQLEAFQEQLKSWESKGHCLYLHGCKHKANSKHKRSLFGKIALALTNEEAEFAGLDCKTSRELLGEALRAWQAISPNSPTGFVPPAWYGSKTLLNLCKELNFENYHSRFIIWNKQKGSRLSIPFSTAGLPRAIAPLVKLCEKIYVKLYKTFNFLPIPRIVEHP